MNMALRKSARSLHRIAVLARSSQCGTFINERSSSLPSRLGEQERSVSTDSNQIFKNRILFQSSILQQDGLDIDEIPVVIRRITAAEIPHTYMIDSTPQTHEHVTEQDELFKYRLQNCKTVRQVFNLLEIPGEYVTQTGAAFALERLAQLQEGISTRVDTFIRKAVFNELCDTATQEMTHLTCDRLISLIKCYLKANTFAEVYQERIDNELERRIGDGKFSIAQLCSLIQLMSENVKGDQNLVNNIWIHLGNRYKEVREEDIKHVFPVLRNMSPGYKYILKLLDKQIYKMWWKMQPVDVNEICKAAVLVNHRSPPLFMDLGKWLFVHIHEITDLHLATILTAYNHFGFSDYNLTVALDRYVTLKVSNMDKKTVGLAMDYCYNQRYFSPRMLNAVAEDFEKNNALYTSSQMFQTVRVFGYLNYSPPNASKLFREVDKVLLKRFSDFQAYQILEMLASFVYLKQYPSNFVGRIFNPHFLARLQGVETTPVRNRAIHHLRLLYCSAKLEMLGPLPAFVGDDILHGHYKALKSHWMQFHQNLSLYLYNEVNASYINTFGNPKGTPYYIDFELAVNSDGELLKPFKNGNPARRVAILTVMPEHTCINSAHVLGEYAMRRRHLQALGYSTVEVDYSAFSKLSEKEKKDFISDLIKRCCASKTNMNCKSVFDTLVGEEK